MVGQFCKKAADAVSEFYEEHKTVINAIVGVAVLIACTAATIATGGDCGFLYAVASRALIGAVVGAAQGAIGGLITGAVEYYEEYGTLDGSKDKLMESYTEGFAIGAFSGALEGGFGGALEYVKSPGSFCFIAGTLIVTPLGMKAIEDFEVGDMVLSTDPDTRETTEKTVLSTFARETTKFTDVTIGGETYHTTPEHPFYVEGKDFVEAAKLEVGDKVVCYDAETDTTDTKEVESVHVYETNEPIMVYNIEVDVNHTYHVGEDGVLVHNLECGVSGDGGSKNTGTYGELVSNGQKDAHHIIQDAAVRDVPGYDRMDAPAIQLDGPSNVVGTEHYYATITQRINGGGTYGSERGIAYMALRKAGLSVDVAKAAIRGADDYFMGKLGMTLDSPTRIPGNRRK